MGAAQIAADFGFDTLDFAGREILKIAIREALECNTDLAITTGNRYMNYRQKHCKFGMMRKLRMKPPYLKHSRIEIPDDPIGTLFVAPRFEKEVKQNALLASNRDMTI